MTKSPDKNRAEQRRERRAATTTSSNSNNPYKMRSAASRRAEARARADYRGASAEPRLEGLESLEDGGVGFMPTRDVGVRIDYDAKPRPKKKKFGDLDAALVAELLHNPTKEVSAATLKEQYSYVIADIRSMAILAAGLFALLIVLAFVLPR